MLWWEYLIIGFLIGELVGEQIQRYRAKIGKSEEDE